MGTLTNNYIFKALENYPYDLEEVMEGQILEIVVYIKVD